VEVIGQELLAKRIWVLVDISEAFETAHHPFLETFKSFGLVTTYFWQSSFSFDFSPPHSHPVLRGELRKGLVLARQVLYHLSHSTSFHLSLVFLNTDHPGICSVVVSFFILCLNDLSYELYMWTTLALS
jgi:hypothetical protein